MTSPMRVNVSFGAAVAVIAAALFLPVPDPPFWACVVLAAGQIWASRSRRSWIAAAVLLVFGIALANPIVLLLHPNWVLLACVALGAAVLRSSRKPAAWVAVVALFGVSVIFSTLDPAENSSYWRLGILAAKAKGALPHVSWKRSLIESLSDRPGLHETRREHPLEVVDSREGRFGTLELYRTGLGDMWASAAKLGSFEFIVEEVTRGGEYEFDGIAIESGDVVIDCGAHVGLYTKLALARGAARVIAIEPDPENALCFRENLATEIADGRVELIQAGVWDERDSLTLHHSTDNAGSHSFLEGEGESISVAQVPVVPLDEIVDDLKLDRVDWIKMDIEGAERRALGGATKTLRRFKPRLAICTYHLQDDPDAIPPTVLAANPDFRVAAKHVVTDSRYIRPKVLFFY